MKRLLLSSYAILCFSMLFAQQMELGEIPTPQAASIGKYGDVPMSYYTGQADITIPLYSFTLRDVTLPIYLSYDSSGLQPNSLPGWTGHNWTLMAGGAITRVVQGNYDEFVYPAAFYFTPETFTNYFHSYGAINRLYNNDKALRDTVVYNRVDLAPDIFYFNFMGFSGRFFLGNDGEWKVASDQNIEVVFDYKDESNFIYPFIKEFPYILASDYQPKTIKGFLLRDDRGNKYYFGGNTDAIEYRTDFFRMAKSEAKASWLANSWYLTKVTDRHDNVLYTFEYERGYFMAQIMNSVIGEEVNNWDSGFGGYGNYYKTLYTAFPYQIELNAPILLSKLTLADGRELKFTYTSPIPTKNLYASGTYSSIVQKIRSMYDNKSATDRFFYLQTDVDSIKRYQLHLEPDNRNQDPLSATGYSLLYRIYSTNNSLLNYQLDYHMGVYPMLSSVSKMSVAMFYDFSHALKEKYTLKYDGLSQLPFGHLTTAVDHWGYYNGNPYNLDASSDLSSFASTRDANPEYARRGLLKEIVYPTGGCSVFEYEANYYAKCMSLDRQTIENSTGIAGGMRIKSITEYEDTTHATILKQRVFDYRVPGTNQSSGQLFAKPVYYWTNWRPVDVNGGHSINENYFRSSSIVPLSNSFGPHIGYSYVRETFSDGTYHIYHYSNIADCLDDRFVKDYNDGTLSPYDRFSERGYTRGRLLGKSIYDALGNKKQEESYDYCNHNDFEGIRYVLTSNLRYENTGNSATFGHWNGGIYKLFYPKYHTIRKTVRTYNNQQTVEDRYDYVGTEELLSVSYGTGQHYVSIYKPSSETHTRGGEKMTALFSYPYNLTDGVYQTMTNQFCLPVVSEERRNQNAALVDKKVTEYASFKGLVLPSKEISYVGSGEGLMTIQYLDYTNTGALAKYKQRGKPVTALTWQNNDLYLQKKVEGYLLTTTCTYNEKLLPSVITYPNGDFRSYVYDSFNQLVEIKDRNGNTIQKFSYQYRNK